MADEGWELCIRHRTDGVAGTARFYFHIEVIDTTATYRERAASLSVSLTGLIGWFDRFRLLYSFHTEFTSVLWRRRNPSYGWWDDGSIQFAGSHGSWITDPASYSDHFLLNFWGGYEDGARSWNCIGPLPNNLYAGGSITAPGVAVAEDFVERHIQTYTTVLGDKRRGGILLSDGTIVPAFSGRVYPYTGRSKLRRRKL